MYYITKIIKDPRQEIDLEKIEDKEKAYRRYNEIISDFANEIHDECYKEQSNIEIELSDDEFIKEWKLFEYHDGDYDLYDI